MAEHTDISYRRLFEVRLLHHYWLDEGETPFEHIADQQMRTRRLLRYDARQLVTATPGVSTRALLAGLGGVYRTTGLGFVAAVSRDAVLASDNRFEFYLTPTASDLASYTAMTLRGQQLVELITLSGRTIRYKNRTPLLSNLTGAARTLSGSKHLFLSCEYPGGVADRVEELVAAGNQLRRLTSDQPGAAFQQLGAIADLPVYLHQGDAPVIVAPPGVVGAPSRGVELSADAPADLLAVIRLTPLRPDDDDFSFIDANGHPLPTCPIFEVHLKNRSTIWRYRNKGDGSVISTEGQPHPLTYFGNAGTKARPSPDRVAVELDPNSPGRVAQLVSEIFV